MNIVTYMKKHHMVSRGDLVLAAVSGGADSVAMLLALQELAPQMGFALAAVHVEHGIRGQESLDDAQFVEELCRERQIPLYLRHVDVPAYAATQKLGYEEAARQLRYQAFQLVAIALTEDDLMTSIPIEQGKGLCVSFQNRFQQDSREVQDDDPPVYEENDSKEVNQIKKRYSRGQIKIALAHHMGDQAETVLFRLARGSGARGLAGMQPVRVTEQGVTYIRPLLATSREDILAYLDERQQSYREDATNEDRSYARNRLRHEVLPQLSRINPQAVAHIAQAAEQVACQQDYIRQQVEAILKELTEEWQNEKQADADTQQKGTEKEVTIPIITLRQLHPALQSEILRQALTEVAGHEKDISSIHMEELLDLTTKTSGSRISLPYGVEAERVFGNLVIHRIHEDENVTDSNRYSAAASPLDRIDETVSGDTHKIANHNNRKEDDRKTITGNDTAGTDTATGDSKAAESVMDTDNYNITAADLNRIWESGLPCRIFTNTGEAFYLSLFPTKGHKGGMQAAVEALPEAVFSPDSTLSQEILQENGKKGCTKSFSYDTIGNGFAIRHRQAGDYLYMEDGHRKKLKQYLIEQQIPATERGKLWVIADGSHVYWVAGLRQGADCRVRRADAPVVYITYLTQGGEG